MLHFHVAILLSSHGFEVNWICRHCGATILDGSSGGGGGWAGQKIGYNIFQTRQIQHLHIEFRNESQMALLLQQNGAETRDNAVTSGLWSVYNSKA